MSPVHRPLFIAGYKVHFSVVVHEFDQGQIEALSFSGPFGTDESAAD